MEFAIGLSVGMSFLALMFSVTAYWQESRNAKFLLWLAAELDRLQEDIYEDDKEPWQE